eukprot:Hpha_TRINITY_DN22678_c0_g1::TRINITY_DN22678_c0_g1_i1::g.192777::m.192777
MWRALTLGLAAASHAAVALTPVEVVHNWTVLEYAFDSPAERQAALDSGAWKQHDCVPTGIKLCGPSLGCPTQRLFVSVPRWFKGVYATLTEVEVDNVTGASLLRPWPSVAAQDPTDCSKIQYVQSMEIDLEGVMWVLDVGRKYFAGADPLTHDNKCPPKLVWVNISTAEVIDTFVFPTEVAPYDGSQLNDLVLDVVEQVAYISSSDPPPLNKCKGGLVVFDRKQRKSRRFEDATTHAEVPAYNSKIHGQGFPSNLILNDVPADGIALPPTRDRLFWCTNGGAKLYSVPTALLRNFSTSAAEIAAGIVHLGKKASNSDGMAFGANGALFFGGLETDSVYRLDDPRGPTAQAADAVVVAKDEALWWPDTFSFDNEGYLWVTSNKIDSILFPPWRMSVENWWNGKHGPNFHISKVYVGTNSYLLNQTAGRAG